MNERPEPAAPPPHVVSAFGLTAPQFEQITSGHINLTWHLHQSDNAALPRELILQRVNPIFHPSVQHDIWAVTSHLRSEGINTIEMIQTLEGEPCLERGEEVWRLTRFIEGTTPERVETASQASQAGRALGEFHVGMRSFRGTLSQARTNVHDFSLHLQRLDMALLEHREHPHHGEAAALATQIVELAAEIRDFPPTRSTFAHGDPKISNIVFDNDEAVCLIDLDTLASMPIEIEIADALRSWCNTEAEDSLQSRFSIELFAAACRGYGRIDREVAEMLPDTTAKIAVELATRFCTDSLEERYFGWDRERFKSAGEHNRVRSQAQLTLATDILRQRAELHRIVAGI